MSINLYIERAERLMLKRNLGSLSLPHRHHSGGQYAKFRLPEKGSRQDTVYNWELDIYDGELHYNHDNLLMSFKGRVVKNIIESILEGSCQDHLEGIIDGCKWRIEQLKEKGELNGNTN
jgi:hypothetical protein